jgi:mono/diheme cytochrome c family protein
VAPPVFVHHCASCHGEKGRGDGPAGRFLNPPPRNFADAEWQASITDERLRQTIRQGGGPMGLSPAMASHPDLSSEQIEELIRYIRSLPDA